MRLPEAGDMAKVLIEVPGGTFVTQIRLSQFTIHQHMKIMEGYVTDTQSILMKGEIPGYLFTEGDQGEVLPGA